MVDKTKIMVAAMMNRLKIVVGLVVASSASRKGAVADVLRQLAEAVARVPSRKVVVSSSVRNRARQTRPAHVLRRHSLMNSMTKKYPSEACHGI